MPLSTRTVVAFGMTSLALIGVATVFGDTILAFVAPPPEVSGATPTPTGPAAGAPAPPNVAPAGPAPSSDTSRSASPAHAKDASS